jgi:hypothetical protein
MTMGSGYPHLSPIPFACHADLPSFSSTLAGPTLSPHSVFVHQAWPEAEFIVVPDAGHSAMEVGITSNLIAATNKFRPAATH